MFGRIKRIMGLSVVMALGCACAPAGFAQGLRVGDTPQQITIPAGSLSSALTRLVNQVGVQIMYEPALTRGFQVGAVNGKLTFDEALARLLANTGLKADSVDEKTVVLRRTESATSNASTAAEMKLAQANPSAPIGQSEEAARASGSQNASPNERDSKIQEIIVTATKRAERLQDVPMSIAVIGKEDIERRGLIGMEDYLRSIPGVNQVNRGGLDNSIVIRGIATSVTAQNFTTGTTVATYFDETPITGAAGPGTGGIDIRPVDFERIEVLRGPQGTAFGAASLSGTMRMIPAKPKLDSFGADLAASYSDTGGHGSDNTMIQGVFNIPVIADKFALRAVGYRYEDSGYYTNTIGSNAALIAAADSRGVGDFVRGYSQDDLGRMRSTGGRLAALWQATDKLNLSLNALTQKIEQDGSPVADVGPFEQAHAPIAPQGRVRGTDEISDTEIDLVNLVLNYDLGWSTLTSAASWVDSGSVYSQSGFSPVFSLFGPYSYTGWNDFKSFTGEVRLASRLPGRFQFLAGVFYENVDDEVYQPYSWPGTPANNPFPLRTDPMGLYITTRSRDQRAVFGELSFDVTDKVTATVGGRFFKYARDERVLLEGGLYGFPIGGGVPQILANDDSDSSFKASLEYQPVEDALLYASWGQGFRLGRPAAGVVRALCDPNGDGLIDGTGITVESTRSIGSDFLDNYEVGGKFALFDRRMVVDTAVYHIEWDGLPITAVPPGAAAVCGYTTNAGTATSDGVELQASVFVTNGLRVDFGGGYANAQLSSNAPGLGPDGARLPGSPKVNVNLAVQQDFTVGGYRAFVRADSFYAGKFYGDLLESAGTVAGDYILLDARVGVAIRNLSVDLFVRNLTDEDAFTWRTATSSNANPFLGYRLRPRTVGIQLGYAFGR